MARTWVTGDVTTEGGTTVGGAAKGVAVFKTWVPSLRSNAVQVSGTRLMAVACA